MLKFCGEPNGCADVGNANNFFFQFSLENLNIGRVILVLYRPIPKCACKKSFDSKKRHISTMQNVERTLILDMQNEICDQKLGLF